MVCLIHMREFVSSSTKLEPIEAKSAKAKVGIRIRKSMKYLKLRMFGYFLPTFLKVTPDCWGDGLIVELLVTAVSEKVARSFPAVSSISSAPPV